MWLFNYKAIISSEILTGSALSLQVFWAPSKKLSISCFEKAFTSLPEPFGRKRALDGLLHLCFALEYFQEKPPKMA